MRKIIKQKSMPINDVSNLCVLCMIWKNNSIPKKKKDKYIKDLIGICSNYDHTQKIIQVVLGKSKSKKWIKIANQFAGLQ